MLDKTGFDLWADDYDKAVGLSDEEKKLTENCIYVVQILHHLNNIAPYKVKKYNEKGEIEEVEPNTEEVSAALTKANKAIDTLK